MWAAYSHLTALLAQADVIPQTPAGWAGWASFVTSGGVFIWFAIKKDQQLQKFVEDKDKQIETLINNHLKTEERQREVHSLLEEKQRNEYRDTLRAMMEHNTKQIESLGNALREDLQALQKTIEAFGSIIHQMANRRRATDDK